MGNGNKAELTDRFLSILSTPVDRNDCPVEYSPMGRPHLSKLRLHACPDITDVGVGYLGGGGKPNSVFHHFLGCRHLTHVTLMDCQSVTDKGIRQLCKGCPEIRVLELINCDGIADDALAAACAHCRHLTSINLFGCRGIGTKGFHFLDDLAGLPPFTTASM